MQSPAGQKQWNLFFNLRRGKGLSRELPAERRQAPSEGPETLIEMKDTTVSYDDQVVLDRLSWAMRRGENWAVLGPNGAGKSTLVKLILGENLQAYANQIFLFGRRRGSGESIWISGNESGSSPPNSRFNTGRGSALSRSLPPGSMTPSACTGPRSGPEGGRRLLGRFPGH